MSFLSIVQKLNSLQQADSTVTYIATVDSERCCAAAHRRNHGANHMLITHMYELTMSAVFRVGYTQYSISTQTDGAS